ncbi:MAG: hypothetical protein ABJJ69_05300, partial [Paracoccaceae bacterium]
IGNENICPRFSGEISLSHQNSLVTFSLSRHSQKTQHWSMWAQSSHSVSLRQINKKNGGSH